MQLRGFFLAWGRGHQAAGEELSQRQQILCSNKMGKPERVHQRGMWFDGGWGREGTYESENI